jgi:hypothetical protein
MTDTAKPTSGPWDADNILNRVRGYDRYKNDVCGAVYNPADRELIAEAGTVYHETGLTPRQLLEQRDELVEFITQLKNYCDEEVRKLDEYAEDVASRNTIESIQDDLNVMFIKCGKVGG